ncbi:hypothetical protein E5329_26235 [Petralouisia muris]|uniref:Uncharacterized protein n=1 Tax=Petralouisia muris TaxID=3032872 RepID=A0AC61RNS5_9FIRM|nr:hypothetical protein [Petralouisia muris]TGY88012.1 hypothetical protein E5329_26235 [Petralouisia muris]
MQLMKVSAMFVFAVSAFALLYRTYFPIVKDIWVDRIRNKKNAVDETEGIVQSNLSKLRKAGDSVEKAAAFVVLMNLSYVLVHTLVNKGNNYNDRVQSLKFRKSLTPETLTRLRSLEGEHE